MQDPITDYQRWKQQGEDLRARAKQAMETRFRELLTEAMQLSEEYKADFGKALKPPAAVTAFRYKATARHAARPASKQKAASKAEPAKATAAPTAAAPRTAPRAASSGAQAPTPQAGPAKPAPRVAALEKKLATARQKLEAARAAGSPTQNLEDRVYELEDELRLLRID